MPNPALVISDPPHGDFDAARAAPVLGLHPVDLTLKARYSIPEIWLALADQNEADSAAGALRAAGCHVAVATGNALRDVPAQALVEDVAYEESGLVMVVNDTELTLPYDLPAVAVLCAPREEKDKKGEPVEGTGAHGTFLDVYVTWPGGVQRLGIVQGITGFSKLDGAARLSASGRLHKCVNEFEARLSRASVDRRLGALQLRRRLTGTTLARQRKGFSYATPALDALLRSIAPGLEQVGQCELCSRLVYLTRAASGA